MQHGVVLECVGNVFDLARLVKRRESLGDQLTELRAALRAAGDADPLPLKHLLVSITACHDDLFALTTDAAEAAVALRLHEVPSSPDLPALDRLLLRMQEAAADAMRTGRELAEARSILTFIQQITYIRELPALDACKQRAGDLLRAIDAVEAANEDPAAILAELAPFEALVTLVREGQEMDVVAADELHEVISNGLHRHLALAAAQGQLSGPAIVQETPPLITEHDEDPPVPPADNALTSSGSLPPKPAPFASGPMVPTSSPFSLRRTSKKHKRGTGEIVADALRLTNPFLPSPGRPSAAIVTAPTSQSPEEPTIEPEGATAAQPAEATIPLTEEVPTPAAFDAPEPIVTAVDEPEVETAQLAPEAPIAPAIVEPLAPAPRIEELTSVVPQAAPVVPQAAPVTPHTASSATVWTLLASGRPGLAALLQEAEAAIAAGPVAPPAWLLRATSHAPRCRYGSAEVTGLLKADFELFDPYLVASLDPELAVTTELLIAAAALQPALLAPETGATTYLRELSLEGWPALMVMRDQIADFGERGRGVDPTLLRRVKNTAAWQADADEFRRELAEYLSHKAPNRTIKATAATKIWQKWLEPGQVLEAMLSPISRGEQLDLEALRAHLVGLAEPASFRRRVDHTDRKLVGRRTGENIHSDAFNQLRAYFQEALAFGYRWIEIQEARPGEKRDFLLKTLGELRDSLVAGRPALTTELQSRQRDARPPVRAAISVLASAIDSLFGLFDTGTAPVELAPTREALHLDLLRTPLRLGDDWLPEAEPSEAIRDELVRLAPAGPADWQAVFHDHLQAGDLENAHRVLEYLRGRLERAESIDSLQDAFDQRVESCSKDLKSETRDAIRRIEKEVASGLLQESERARLLGSVHAVAGEQTLRFRDQLTRLMSVRDDLELRRERASAEIRKRVADAEIRPESSAFHRIEKALKRGDLLVANEYVDLASRGEDLPAKSPTARDPFKEFFPEGAAQLIRLLEDSAASAGVRQALADRRALDGLAFDQVPAAHLEQAGKGLAAWYEAKRSQKLTPEQATEILTFLGLAPRNGLAVGKLGRHARIDLVTEPIEDRQRCPVPAYGSAARGRYLVLGVFGQPTEEDLLYELDSPGIDAPQIVLYFGPMSIEGRRQLARLCRERQQMLVLVDEALLLFLCAERGARLPVMLRCALPFTHLEPYVIAPGHAPPEVFSGRSRELKDILNPTGSCIIYGGRQLGKTALLRHAERVFRDEAQERHAIWIDLKGRGIDTNADTIWTVLTAELKAAGVFDAKTPNHLVEDTFIRKLKDWFADDPQARRRILLLLDEADGFLEFDGREKFRRTDRLRELMAATNYRFKAVFAGLHNVQRSAQVANNPLAHFGQPICIGPLMTGEDGRAARELIERPMAALGYRFENTDLVTRILSQTNYFPSLIQLYCTYLLRHVAQPTKTMFDARTSPPFVITAKHVDDAYQVQELREAIRYRFVVTIGLDKRYEVIAYTIALETLADRQTGMIDGFTIGHLRHEALRWWSEGFAQSAADDAFRVLLEEMVGLGILREAAPGRYALRSPNLLVLIGDEEEIVRQLGSKRDAVPPFDPAVFRGAYRAGGGAETSDLARRNPLTLKQAYELKSPTNAILVACGTAAAGFEELLPFLEADHGEYFQLIGETPSLRHFDQKLEHLIKNRRTTPAGNTIILVPPSSNWTMEWGNVALQRLRKLTSATSFVKVVFAANPALLWRLCRTQGAEAFAQGTPLVTLGPWHDCALQQWLVDCDMGLIDRAHLSQATGNWPELLGQFYGRVKDNLHRWQPVLDEVETQILDPGHATTLVRAFGCDTSPPGRVLKAVAQWGQPIDPESVRDLVDSELRDAVPAAWRWAELLGLVRPASAGEWALDPIVELALREAT